jgi:hypothetical protein
MPDDQGNMHKFLIEKRFCLPDDPMVPERLSMVRGIDDQGIIIHAQFLDLVEKLTDPMIA